MRQSDFIVKEIDARCAVVREHAFPQSERRPVVQFAQTTARQAEPAVVYVEVWKRIAGSWSCITGFENPNSAGVF